MHLSAHAAVTLDIQWTHSIFLRQKVHRLNRFMATPGKNAGGA